MQMQRLLLVVFVSFCSRSLCASQDLFALSIEDLMNIPISSSTLREESLRSVPAAVTVFNQDQIQRLGFTRLQDLMNFVPGFQVNRTDVFSGSKAYSVHGRRLGTTGLEVLVLLDGQRLNSDWVGGANLHHADIALDNVERVEFLRGPGSALFGSNALMGVINIITRNEKEIGLEAGQNGHYRGSAQWRQGDEQRNVSLFARNQTYDGQSLDLFRPSQNDTIASHDPTRGYEIHAKAQWDGFSGAFRHTQFHYNEFYVIGFVDNDSNRFDTESTYMNAQWQGPLYNEATLFANLSLSHRQYQLASDEAGLGVTGGITEWEPTAQVRLQDSIGQHRWLLGTEYRQPKLEDLITPPSTIDVAKRDIFGLFGQYQYQWHQGVTLTLGIRGDDYSDFGHSISPRAGIVYELTATDTLKALYAEAFRAPTRFESWPASTAILVGNPNLKPEEANTYQLIWLRNLEQGSLHSTLFYTEIKNAIRETPANSVVQRTWINDHKNSLSGLEIEWAQAFNPHWSSTVAMTQLLDEPSKINSEAATLLAATLSYQRRNWLVTLRSHYQGPREDTQGLDSATNTEQHLRMGGRTLWDLHTQYEWQRGLSVYATLTNFSDKQYTTPANRSNNVLGVPAQGSHAILGLRWAL